MGSKDQGQGVVSDLVMAEAEGIDICFGKPVCPVGSAGEQKHAQNTLINKGNPER
jgi:hypothetical protein